MKTFIRTNAIYKAENKQLADDIDITDLCEEKTAEPNPASFETGIAELNAKIDELRGMYDELTKVVNAPKVVKAKNTPVSKTAKSKKAVVKKK